MLIQSVTVYCSSSRTLAPPFYDSARKLGKLIAEQNWTLIYGGDTLGLMGAVADGAHLLGGKVIGVMPHRLHACGSANQKCDEMIVVDTMRQRKQILEERADAFITLPGGIGTFEEFFEILVGQQLGFHHKPIVLLNTERYYDPLLEMMRHGVEQSFISPRTLELFHVATDQANAVEWLKQHRSI